MQGGIALASAESCMRIGLIYMNHLGGLVKRTIMNSQELINYFNDNKIPLSIVDQKGKFRVTIPNVCDTKHRELSKALMKAKRAYEQKTE